MKNIFKIFLSSGLVFLFLPGCVDQIDLDPPSGLTEAIVIQGRAVLGDNSRVELRVSRLFDFSAESRLSLNVKDVVFFDDQGNEMALEPVNQGEYNTPILPSSPIQLEVGRSYGIRMATFDNRSYESSLDILNDNNPIGSVRFAHKEELEANPIGDVVSTTKVETFVNTTLSPGSNGLLWELDQTYQLTDTPPEGDPKTCYITSPVTVNKLPILRASLESGASNIENNSVAVQPIDFRMAEGMNITVRQFSLSQGAAEYWDNAAVLVEREGDLFDDPVGLLPSNFVNPNDANDEVFGYFFSTKEQISYARVPNSLVTDAVNACPPPPRMEPGGTTICDDCLAGPNNNSTLIRPLFWIE